MTGTPKSCKALRLAVMYARLPDNIDPKASRLLMCLAEHANPDGTNAYPGNASLCAAIDLRWTATHAQLEKLVAAGLCKRTFTPHGRPSNKSGDQKATIWALCLDNPAYPDHAPNGECLVQGIENKAPENIRPNRTFSEKTSGSEAENIRPDSEKHTEERSKTYGLTTVPHQRLTKNLPITYQTATADEDSSKDNYQGKAEKYLATLVAEYGIAVVVNGFIPIIRQIGHDNFLRQLVEVMDSENESVTAVSSETQNSDGPSCYESTANSSTA